jgi:hypothetical protein
MKFWLPLFTLVALYIASSHAIVNTDAEAAGGYGGDGSSSKCGCIMGPLAWPEYPEFPECMGLPAAREREVTVVTKVALAYQVCY